MSLGQELTLTLPHNTAIVMRITTNLPGRKMSSWALQLYTWACWRWHRTMGQSQFFPFAFLSICVSILSNLSTSLSMIHRGSQLLVWDLYGLWFTWSKLCSFSYCWQSRRLIQNPPNLFSFGILFSTALTIYVIQMHLFVFQCLYTNLLFHAC